MEGKEDKIATLKWYDDIDRKTGKLHSIRISRKILLRLKNSGKYTFNINPYDPKTVLVVSKKEDEVVARIENCSYSKELSEYGGKA